MTKHSKSFSILSVFFLWMSCCPLLQSFAAVTKKSLALVVDTTHHPVLEPYTYTEDFQDRDLGAWASYPLWQDNAYNQNFRVNEIVPGDPNISIVQKVTPYTAVDNYAGAQKRLFMYLVPGSIVKFRFYIKSNLPAEWYKVRFAAGALGKLEVTIPHPQTNQWVTAEVTFADFVKENPKLSADGKYRIFGLAFLTKIANADPDMPFYLGLDDIVFKGARVAPFGFMQPLVDKLPEFEPYIPKKAYNAGDMFQLDGKWVPDAQKVMLKITPFAGAQKLIFEGKLSLRNGSWSLNPLKLDFPTGLYLATLTAFKDKAPLAITEFTIHIAPNNIGGQHPRLLFNDATKKAIDLRFKTGDNALILSAIKQQAKEQRDQITPESLVYDLDQFPDENWLPTWAAWGSHIYHTGEALRLNARSYSFNADLVAGKYVIDVLMRLSQWPDWTHPWQTKRGRYSEHRTGAWSHRLAEAYDLVYPMMTENQRTTIRKAIMKNIIENVHHMYVYNDDITAASSNWVAMTVGGSLMNMAAIYEDGPESADLEPYFTGAMMKLDRFVHHVTDSKDGAWGEGWGYNNYTFSNLSYSLPSIENVFHVDLSKPLDGTYRQFIWAGWVKGRKWFDYGDSGDEMVSANNWAYLLSKYKDPLLSWFYHYLKQPVPDDASKKTKGHGTQEVTDIQTPEGQTYEDIVFNTANIPQKDPFQEKPVKLFKEIGTTVFKSGWEINDFVFVMRTGAFYNHQHLDQGSFWIADRGQTFTEERQLKNSDYYDDPIYESWLTQPIAHSTILVNGNHQSQRVGDPFNFLPGFDDHAFVSAFLDGKNAAFVTGDIGKLYWGTVKSLTRNVLYLKPRTVLMLDVAVPAEKDVDINLLYQTARFKDIAAGDSVSTITKGDATLHLLHLSPQMETQAVKTPHYLKTLNTQRPLEWEGMLTVSSRTHGKPLVMANLLTTTATGDHPDVNTHSGNGYISGTASGQPFAYSTAPGNRYEVENWRTDALALTWDAASVFVAQCTEFSAKEFSLTASVPVTFEWQFQQKTIRYNAETAGTVKLVMGNKVKTFAISAGEGTILVP